jgi:hypothetical protein
MIDCCGFSTCALWPSPGSGTNQFRSGLDVVVEGTGVPVTDTAQLQRLAALWKSKLDWDFEVTDGGFRDPAGRLGLVFGLTQAKILAFGKTPTARPGTASSTDETTRSTPLTLSTAGASPSGERLRRNPDLSGALARTSEDCQEGMKATT